MRKSVFFTMGVIAAALIFSRCNQGQPDNASADKTETVSAVSANGGFASNVKWGEHLVTICGCNDCHTPKKMTPMGPVTDTSLMLSGHPSQMPLPDVNIKEIQSKGLAVTSGLTVWVGPWGVSFAANLTPDSTGTGGWKEDQFMLALREGKSKGLPGNRTLLPPMPWEMYKTMSDDELKAVFAYLQSLKPVHNVVPQPLPPVGAPGK